MACPLLTSVCPIANSPFTWVAKMGCDKSNKASFIATVLVTSCLLSTKIGTGNLLIFFPHWVIKRAVDVSLRSLRYKPQASTNVNYASTMPNTISFTW